MGFFSEVCLVLDQFPYLPPIMYAFICAGSFIFPGKQTTSVATFSLNMIRCFIVGRSEAVHPVFRW